MISFQKILTQFNLIKTHWKNFYLYVSASVISAIIGVALNPIMAKNLSPTDFAIIGYYSSFVSFILPITNFSILTYYLRIFFKVEEFERKKIIDTLVVSLFIIGILTTILTLSIFSIVHLLLNSNFDFFPYAYLSFIPIFFGNFLVLYQIEFRMRQESKKYAKITILNSIITAFFALLFVVAFKWGAGGKLASVLVSSIIFCIYSIYKLISKLQFDKKIFRDAIIFGWPVTISSLLNYFLLGIDRTFLLKINDTYQYALYVIALGVVGYLSLFYFSIYQTFEPNIYKAVAENNKKKLLKIISTIFIFTSFIVFVFILLAKIILQVLTYNIYTEAYVYARIISISALTTVLHLFTSSLLIAYGHQKFELLSKLTGSIFTVIIYYYLIQNYGFIGGAWGQVFSFLPIIIINLTILKYKLNLNK